MQARKKKFYRFIIDGNLPTPTSGHIVITVSGSDSAVQLSGSGNGWSVDDQGIRLKPPPGSTVWYQLTLKLVQPLQQQTFSLVGVQILRTSQAQPSTENAAIFIPASDDEAQVNLLHKIPSNGSTVTYDMLIGLFNGSTTSWHYPTISFDPEAGPPQQEY